MELNVKCLHLLLGCLIIGFSNNQLVKALQCYICDNCVDGTDLYEIQICGELPYESTTQSTSSAAPVQPTNQTTTIEPTPFQTDTVTSTVSRTNTTTRRASTTTRRPASTTTKKPTTKDDSEENYSDYEDSDENDRRRLATMDEHFDKYALKGHAPRWNYHGEKQLIHGREQFEPVCFMVKFRVNNTQLTSLGCTTMIKNNIFLTCQSLNRTDAKMEDCQLCGRNGCNKLLLDDTNNDMDWDDPWYNSGSELEFRVMNYFVIILLLKLIN